MAAKSMVKSAAKGAQKSPAKKSPKGTDEVSRLCHALSDPTRVAILDRLRNGEQCVCNLVDLIGGGQSRLSFHLKTLKDAGLVRDRREGRWVHYSLSSEAIALLHAFVAGLERCCAPDANDSKNAKGCC
jgi:ArsR family transcriptional regulator